MLIGMGWVRKYVMRDCVCIRPKDIADFMVARLKQAWFQDLFVTTGEIGSGNGEDMRKVQDVG